MRIVLTRIVLALPLLIGVRAQAETFAIKGTTLRSPKKTTEGVTIVIQDGKVTAAAKGAAIPSNATVIDGTGTVVTAGLVAAGTRIGLVEIGAVDYTQEGSFGGDELVHAAYNVRLGYNPDSMVIDVARNGGVTSSISIPRGGLIPGQSAWLSLSEGTTAENTIKEVAAVHVVLGRSAVEIMKGARGLALHKLRALFEDAQHYAANKNAFGRGQSRPYAADFRDLEALLPVLQGQIPLVVHADRRSDLAAAVALARDFNLRLVIQGGTEAWTMADELAREDVAVIVNPMDNLPSSFDEIQVVDDQATRLAEAGVKVIISPHGSAADVRRLRQLAGLAVAHGLPWETALAAITSHPAEVFGAPRGEVKVGAIADLVVWSGDPLELSSRATHIFIGGKLQPMENHQTRLLDRYRPHP